MNSTATSAASSAAPSTSTSPACAPSKKKIPGKKIPVGGRQPKLAKVQSLHKNIVHDGLKSHVSGVLSLKKRLDKLTEGSRKK